MEFKICCIIPYHNENNRIQTVLNSILLCPLVSEVLCVDDGSTDGGFEFIQSAYPSIRNIRIAKRIGKAGAVKKGIEQASCTHVLILDADLSHIQAYELEKAILYMRDHPETDRLVFRMARFFWTSRLLRHDILLSGSTIVKYPDLVEFFAERRPQGYELEISLNQYMVDHHKKVVYMPFSAVSYSPIRKQGFLPAVWRDAHLYPQIIRHVGLRNFVRQSLFFARTPAELEDGSGEPEKAVDGLRVKLARRRRGGELPPGGSA